MQCSSLQQCFEYCYFLTSAWRRLSRVLTHRHSQLATSPRNTTDPQVVADNAEAPEDAGSTQTPPRFMRAPRAMSIPATICAHTMSHVRYVDCGGACWCCLRRYGRRLRQCAVRAVNVPSARGAAYLCPYHML